MDRDDFIKNKVKIRLANQNFPDYFNDKERNLMIQNYQENRKDEPSVPENPTFWTTFIFRGTDPKDLHCTHKFLGEQDDASVKKIISTLDNYFAKNLSLQNRLFPRQSFLSMQYFLTH